MSFPRYERYRDSGAEWLGEVPEHWLKSNVKREITFTTGWTPPSGDDSLYGGGIPWATISDLSNRTITETTNTLALNALIMCHLSPVPAGSLLFSFKLSIGQVAFAGMELFTNEAIASFIPSKSIDLGYAYYAFPLFIGINASENIYGAKLLNQELIKNAVLVIPNVEEQRCISKFLDCETAKIDALIDEQRRLIALLKEKRQAIISHAVTKGLNAAAPMKDSGVEWLGEVPEHWGNKRKLLDFAAKQQHSFVNGPFGSDLLTAELVRNGVPVIYVRDLRAKGYSRVSEWCVTPEKASQLRFCNVIPGDILVAKVGDPPGIAAVYPEGEREAIVTQDVIRLRVDREKVNAEFIKWLLNSKYGQTLIEDISVDSTRTRVGLGEYKQLRFFVPPLLEQQTIAAFLVTETARLDVLIIEATRTIDLLQERRSALISAAVTGKIDVRNYSPRETPSHEEVYEPA